MTAARVHLQAQRMTATPANLYHIKGREFPCGQRAPPGARDHRWHVHFARATTAGSEARPRSLALGPCSAGQCRSSSCSSCASFCMPLSCASLPMHPPCPTLLDSHVPRLGPCFRWRLGSLFRPPASCTFVAAPAIHMHFPCPCFNAARLKSEPCTDAITFEGRGVR